MVEKVSDREYFHVTRVLPYSPHEELQVGATLEVGANHNPFFSFYENVRAYPVETPDGQLEVRAIKFLKSVQEGKINCPNLAQIATEIAEHYLLLARELIMEQVRIEISPAAPSRQRCLWLADTFEEAKYWQTRLSGKSLIAHLQVSGTIHRADASLLLGDSEPLATTYERARSYWCEQHSETPELETLFCGSAKVKSISA